MASLIKISPSEWDVLNVVWDKAPATASEISAALADDKDWHPKTVNTFLTRLAEKGVLRVRREGKSNVYVPAKTREQCIRAESDSFLQRVFRGATGPMLLHFVERANLSADEIRELERLLKQKKKS
jgi:BlaI family transcriptional regulator, penicillinase repressor